MKRLLALLLASLMIFSLAACGTPANEPIATDTSEASDPQTMEMTVLETLQIEADALRESILNDNSEVSIVGTTYYVSQNGNDANDGLTPETAWATVQRVSDAELKSGDGVLFERGSIFREFGLLCREGVIYSAYGEGAKPIITGSPENGADASKWSLYGETSDGGKVWKYHRNMRDCGTLILNGEDGIRKITPHWNGEYFVNADGTRFDVLSGLSQDLCFFTPADSLLHLNLKSDEVISDREVGVPLMDEAYHGTEGALYFRCDKGNPGDLFDSIEFSVSPFGPGRGMVDQISDNVFNNIHFFACSDCGFMHNHSDGKLSTFQNCEISFMGSGLLFYGEDGRAEVGGDGMNIQRPALVTNCYFHHNAENGITCETGDGVTDVHITDITIRNNLFERNGEDIQFVFFEPDMKASNCSFRNILVEGNIMTQTVGGWSSYIRSDAETGECFGVCIKCGDLDTPLYSENMVIRDNVLFSTYARALIYGGNIGYTPPVFENNRLYLPSGTDENGHRVAVALWANDEYNGEDLTSFYWVWKDEVWPAEFSITSCDDFLNRYLGSGNTVEFIG